MTNMFMLEVIFLYFVVKNTGAISSCEVLKVHNVQCSNALDNHQINTSVDILQKWNNKICHKWCIANTKWIVVDKYLGRVRFNALTSNSTCQHTGFKIHLIPENFKYIHSQIMSPSLSEECKNGSPKELEWYVDFVFEGNYKLKIIPCKNNVCMERSCVIGPFYIETDYKMVKLSTSQLKLESSYSINSSLSISATGVVLSLARQIVFKIYNDSDCYNNQKENYMFVSMNASIIQNTSNSTYIHNMEDVHYDCKSYYDKKGTCRCERTNKGVTCIFENTPPGKYCAVFIIVDVRCCEQTIWNHMHDCHLAKPIVCNKQEKTDLNVRKQIHSESMVILLLCIIIPVTFLTIGILTYYKRKLLVKNKVSFPCSNPKPEPEGELSPKVLLAYPRDCPQFMEIMTEFRKILSEYNKAEVYDVWDSNIWDQVAEKKEQWALKYCYDPNVKIILMVTHCSRVIHDALINGKEIEYLDPEAFDNVFLIILRCIMEISVNEALYKRIYVVRFDGQDIEKNTFKYICPFTVYTIPQQLHNLISQSFNHHIDNPINVANLSSLIDEFNKYKIQNPDYLENMIHIKV